MSPVVVFSSNALTADGRDEILYHARIHPESYTHNLKEPDVAELHNALLYVTRTAVETDADSTKFPKDWLMLHRWGKGRKGEDANKLPNGERIEFVKVGGRTSAFVRNLSVKLVRREMTLRRQRSPPSGRKQSQRRRRTRRRRRRRKLKTPMISRRN